MYIYIYTHSTGKGYWSHLFCCWKFVWLLLKIQVALPNWTHSTVVVVRFYLGHPTGPALLGAHLELAMSGCWRPGAPAAAAKAADTHGAYWPAPCWTSYSAAWSSMMVWWDSQGKTACWRCSIIDSGRRTAGKRRRRTAGKRSSGSAAGCSRWVRWKQRSMCCQQANIAGKTWNELDAGWCRLDTSRGKLERAGRSRNGYGEEPMGNEGPLWNCNYYC